MSKVEIKDKGGKVVKTVDFNSAVFGIEPNTHVMHQVIVNYLAGLRQGTHATKGRSFVSGGGKKPWRQKGTGRARQGSIRAPQWRGGGVVFGPTPHSHAKRTNSKEIKLAMRSVLSAKLKDGELVVVDAIDFKAPKTKDAQKLLAKLGLDNKRVTVVLDEDNYQGFLSFRNLPKVRVIGTSDANAHNLADNKALLLTEKSAQYLEGVLA